jgi:hypothetical protein
LFWLEQAQSGINPISERQEKLQQVDWVYLALLVKAKNGDVNAAKELLDSGYGKNVDQTDITLGGDPDNPIRTQVEWIFFDGNGQETA